MQDIVPLLAPASLAALALSRINQITIPKRIPRELVVLCLLTLYLLVNITINKSLSGISCIDFVRHHGQIFYTLAIFPIFFFIKPTARLEHTLYPAAMYAAFIVAVLCVINYTLNKSLLDMQLYRANIITGTLQGHGPTAGSLAVPIILYFVSLLFFRKRDEVPPVKINGLTIIILSVIVAAFILTRSRGRFLGLLCTFCLAVTWASWPRIMSLRIERKGLVFFTLVIVLSVFFIVSISQRTGHGIMDIKNDPNVINRFLLWNRALKLFSISPLTGIGIGTFQQTNIQTYDIVPNIIALKKSGTYLGEKIHGDIEGGLHAHNVYLQLLVESGLFGTTLLFIFLLSCVLRKPPDRAPNAFEKDTEYKDTLKLARFNRILSWHLIVFLAVTGLTSGFTLFAPSTAWLLYVSMARLVRQHMYLKKSLVKL